MALPRRNGGRQRGRSSEQIGSGAVLQKSGVRPLRQ
jgi:hypothetical protein